MSNTTPHGEALELVKLLMKEDKIGWNKAAREMASLLGESPLFVLRLWGKELQEYDRMCKEE